MGSKAVVVRCCDVYPERWRYVKTYRISITCEDTGMEELSIRRDLSPKARKRLLSAIERALTPRVPQGVLQGATNAGESHPGVTQCPSR